MGLGYVCIRVGVYGDGEGFIKDKRVREVGNRVF